MRGDPGETLPSEGYVSVIKVFKARNTLEQRGLSAARRPEQADELVAADMQGDIVERTNTSALGRPVHLCCRSDLQKTVHRRVLQVVFILLCVFNSTQNT